MDNLRCLLGIRRMDKVTNARIRALCEVTNRIEESVLRWFGHLEKMENDRIAMREHAGVCAGGRSVGQQRKRRIDTVKEC